MRKIILGLVAATIVAAPLALAGPASADTILSTDPTCSPVKEAAAYTETFYKYKPAVNGTGPTYWATKGENVNAPAGAHKLFNGIDYVRDGVKTNSVFHEAVQGVNCGVTLPQFDTTNVAYTPLANVTVPFTPHVKTYLYGVQGYNQDVPITEDVNVDRTEAWQFWVRYEVEDGYVALNEGQWHIDFWTFTSDFTVPTVTGSGTNGVVDFGDSHNGTWKVGSKVPLSSGDEFLTHGGTELSGPVTRYRLVFTPKDGFVLPDTLPGDGFKVGSSAVYLVYLPANAS